jgi:uncharacterized protein
VSIAAKGSRHHIAKDSMKESTCTGIESSSLTAEEHTILLNTARQALDDLLCGRTIEKLALRDLPHRLRQPGATFVTLTIRGQLRGCVGALEPYRPLAEDVRQHAIAAATQDFRFHPVRVHELAEIKIEISLLSHLRKLDYPCPEDLIASLRPCVDGVLVQDGYRRATFLPQVWRKISTPSEFLSSLCQKMGASPDLWRQKKLAVSIYQVEEIHE